VIYRSKELSIIALIKQKPFSNSENASLNRLYAKATLLMFVVTLTSIIVALLTTYNSVIVRRIVVEQNVFNIPRWATMGFSIDSLNTQCTSLQYSQFLH
jgi:hypothetical protein